MKSIIEIHISRGAQAFDNADLSTAGKNFLLAYKLASHSACEDGKLLAAMWNLALFYSTAKQWKKAENLYRGSLRHTVQHPAMRAFTHHRLAEVLKAQGKDKLAMRAFERAINSYEELRSTEYLPLLERAYDSLVLLCCAHEKFTKAETLCQRAFQFSDPKGETYASYRKKACRLALVYAEMKQFEKAQKIYSQAVVSLRTQTVSETETSPSSLMIDCSPNREGAQTVQIGPQSGRSSVRWT